MTAEKKRLKAKRNGKAIWKNWGPYLAERQWGTVREDYSADGEAWEYTSHDEAKSRAYRWGEEGIGGISDSHHLLCLALGLWNGQDRILKERMFGLGGREGNHGEDVKEHYYYLDSTPTHSYMRMLYKYPQTEFPYEQLRVENQRRDRTEPEFELIDTGVFDNDRYFDVFIEVAKASADDFFIRYRVYNRSASSAELYLLPHAWFRNTWDWGYDPYKPQMKAGAHNRIDLNHQEFGAYYYYCDSPAERLFCENETNIKALFGVEDFSGYAKDGINNYLVNGERSAVNPAGTGTKCAYLCRMQIEAGDSGTVTVRLSPRATRSPFKDVDAVFAERIAEADEFYGELQREMKNEEHRDIQRQAFAGMMWSKQHYYFDVARWQDGDPGQPSPPEGRKQLRNGSWRHLNNSDIISMPDKWEYPWYAAWDTAFHCLPIAMIDSDFAKEQLVLLTREWYMHPNGQLPAYEWDFGDVNPPVHGWAAWRVFKIDQKLNGGKGDLDFLERVLHKLMINFTWWVNRKDNEDNNVFQGGFLGLDNIGVFDRNAELPTGGHLEQSDGTAWMAMYSLNLLRISIELAKEKPVYQDIATKFFEHFLYIAEAMVNVSHDGVSLWNDEDEFYYDVLHLPDHSYFPLKLRSLVGLIPLFAVEVLEPENLAQVPEFRARLEWFLENRPKIAALVSRWEVFGAGHRRLLSLLRGHRMKMLLKRMLDESEFFSDYGVRAMSKHYEKNPYVLQIGGESVTVRYQPGESDTNIFGGNSNWRGPIWFPVNFLIIESLQKFHHYYGDEFKIECPTGSGNYLTILEVSEELTRRLIRIFTRDENGRRAALGDHPKNQTDPHFRDHILFYEYFHGDTGRGAGAAHQTGWTGLIAKLLQPR